MSSMYHLLKFAREQEESFPQHAAAIRDIVSLAEDEIDEGQSVEHETELAIQSINDICY